MSRFTTQDWGGNKLVATVWDDECVAIVLQVIEPGKDASAVELTPSQAEQLKQFLNSNF